MVGVHVFEKQFMRRIWIVVQRSLSQHSVKNNQHPKTQQEAIDTANDHLSDDCETEHNEKNEKMQEGKSNKKNDGMSDVMMDCSFAPFMEKVVVFHVDGTIFITFIEQFKMRS